MQLEKGTDIKGERIGLPADKDWDMEFEVKKGRLLIKSLKAGGIGERVGFFVGDAIVSCQRNDFVPGSVSMDAVQKTIKETKAKQSKLGKPVTVLVLRGSDKKMWEDKAGPGQIMFKK